MRRLSLSALLAVVLGVAMASGLSAWAWDGRWTQAVSGDGIFNDPGSSQGDAGTPERPQTFFTPPPRDYVDVDPEELSDYFDRRNRHYSPYALARIEQNIRYQGIVIPKGYYVIKPGDTNDGSPRINFNTTVTTSNTQNQTLPPISSSQATFSLENEPEPAAPSATAPSGNPPTTSTPVSLTPPEKRQPGLQVGNPDTYRIFVIKRLGKVIAVVPIHRMESYKPSRKEKLPKHALAWVEMENRHPVLKFYYKKRVYATDFQ